VTVASSSSAQFALSELLSDGVFVDGDWVESKDQDPHGDVRLIQLADIGDGVFRNRSSRFLTHRKAKELRCTFLEPGDILVARMPEPLGRACIFPALGQPAVTAVDVCVIRPNAERARPEWLVKAINSPGFRESMQEFVRGTTRQRISRKNLGTLRLTVPHIDEQLAVAHSIERFEAARGDTANRVHAARRALERFRVAILAAACSGRLTEDWRERREAGPDVESLVAEAARCRAGATRKPAVAPADTEFIGAVAVSWRVVSLDAITTRITSGSRDWSKYYGRGSGTFVMAQNVRPGVLDWSFRQAVDPPPNDPSRERSQIYMGDLLITIVGANTGDVGAVLEDQPEHIVCQSVALARPAVPECSAYLNLWFNSSQHGQHYFADCIYGEGRPHLSFDQLRATPIALPALDEQREIVARANTLLKRTDELEARINRAIRSVDRSSQAGLAKAFRGEPIDAASAAV
jgi:type I restriction enzyme, S subunit